MNNRKMLKNIFDDKLVIDKISYFSLFNEKIRHPNYPEGEAVLIIIKCKSEEIHTRGLGDIKLNLFLKMMMVSN